MSTKRQFKGATKPRTFFDRKVRVEGYTRSLSLGKVIPKDWQYVRIRIVARSADFISLEILKLIGGDNDARKNRTSEP